jgi:hypothetical protein
VLRPRLPRCTTLPAHPDHHDSLASIDYTDVDNGMCSWIASVFTLSDDKFMRKCGVDAVQYLKFQRHLIVFVAIMTVVCVGVILPVNFQVRQSEMTTEQRNKL